MLLSIDEEIENRTLSQNAGVRENGQFISKYVPSFPDEVPSDISCRYSLYSSLPSSAPLPLDSGGPTDGRHRWEIGRQEGVRRERTVSMSVSLSRKKGTSHRTALCTVWCERQD